MIPILTCSGHLGKLTPMSGPRLPRSRGGVALEEVEDRSCSPSCKPPMVPSWRLWSGPVGRETEGARLRVCHGKGEREGDGAGRWRG